MQKQSVLFVTGLLLPIVVGCQVDTQIASWPQFRGPGGNAVAPDQSIPDHFGPEQKLRWKVPAPPGSSSPVLWDDRIFLTGHEGKTLRVLCLHRADGSLLWSTEFLMRGTEDLQHRDCSPAGPTPCVDADRVYAYFGTYGLMAFNHDGKLVWEREFPIENNMFGTGTSPVLHDGLLYLVRDVGGLSAVYCFEAASGKQRWMTPRPDTGPNFSTPYIWQRKDRDELVVAGSGTLRAYDLGTGKQLWVVTDMPAWITPSPVAKGDVLVFGAYTAMNIPGQDRMKTGFDLGTDISDEVLRDPALFVQHFDKDGDGKIQEGELPESRVRDAFVWGDANRDGGWERHEIEPFMVMDAGPGRNVLLAVRGGGRGDVTSTHVLWEKTKALPYVASPLIYGNHVYYVKKGGLVSCVELTTGMPVYKTQRLGLGGEYYASPVGVGNRILIAAERGALFVLDAGNRFKIVARNEFGEGIYATPAVVDETLYVRTAEHLWAFGH